MGKKIPLCYLVLYKRIRRKVGNRRYASLPVIMDILKRNLIRFPREIHFPILKELEEYKLLRKINKSYNSRYEIIGGKADVILNKYNCFT